MLGSHRRVFRLPWRTPASDVDAELRAHLEERIAELVAQGVAPAEAHVRASGEFGDYRAIRTDLIEIDRRIARRHSRRDRAELFLLPFRFAARRLMRRPGFFALTAGSLALALGATTAAIGFADAFAHPMLAFDAPERTGYVQMWGGSDRGRGFVTFSDRWRLITATQSFEGYALTAAAPGTVRIGDDVFAELIVKLQPNFATVSGVRLRLGRSFGSGPADEDAALVSDRYWRRYFGGREQLDDATLEVDGRTYRVIGVLPTSPVWPVAGQVFLPLPSGEEPKFFWPLVRLRAGTTSAEVQRQLDAGASVLNAGGDPSRPYGFTLRGFDEVSRRGLDGIHLMMLFVAGFILIIASANVSALLLARAAGRRRDLALRLSLGAGRAAVMVDVLAELVIITGVGLVGGLAMANAATGVARALFPIEITWATSVEMNWSWRVFALAGCALIAVLVVVGLLPALQVSRIPLVEPLKESSGGATARRPQRMKSVVMLQLAASLVMLALASGLIVAAERQSRISFGIDQRRVLSVTGDFVYRWNTKKLDGRSPTDYVFSTIASARGIGVASYYLGAKPDGLQVTSDDIARVGHPLLVDQYTIAGPRFLETVGIPLLEGRDFVEGDSVGTGAVILDDSAAKALFPTGSAVGRRVRMGRATSNEPWRRVIGVTRSIALRFPATTIPARSPAIYVSRTLPQTRRFAVVARVARPEDAATVTQRVRRKVASVVPLSVQLSVQLLSARHDAAIRSQRQLATLFGSLAAGALLFAAAGFFAVLSYSVGQRMREFGVRVAVGASRRDLVRLVIRDAAELALGGTAIGGTAALVLTFLFGEPLLGLPGTSAWALVVSEAILLTVAALATIGPALRAARANPVDVLRAS